MSLLDDNFEMTDVQTIGAICTKVCKEYFDLRCEVTFDGIGKLKLEDILAYPTRYCLASRFDSYMDGKGEIIRICRRSIYTPYWDTYSQLNMRYVLKFYENGVIR